MKIASRERIPVTPRGAGHGAVGRRASGTRRNSHELREDEQNPRNRRGEPHRDGGARRRDRRDKPSRGPRAGCLYAGDPCSGDASSIGGQHRRERRRQQGHQVRRDGRAGARARMRPRRRLRHMVRRQAAQGRDGPRLRPPALRLGGHARRRHEGRAQAHADAAPRRRPARGLPRREDGDRTSCRR